MSRSCDRIISGLRTHHTIHIFHFTNKAKAFHTEANLGGTYTALPLFEDAVHTLNVAWAAIQNHELILKSQLLVVYGSHLCLKGLPMMAQWLEKPFLLCIRGNDFDRAIFSPKKQDLLHAIEHAAGVACVTKEKAARIKTLKYSTPIYYTPNAIALSDWQVLQADQDLAQRYRVKMTIENASTKILGVVGYLKQKKGIELLIKALRRFSTDKFYLRLIGELDPELEYLLQASGLCYSIEKPETKTGLIANYLACDAIVVPSIYEGMPNVLLEAAALKVPILASQAGGIPDVLGQAYPFLYDVLAEDQLQDALARFYNASTQQLEQIVTLLFEKIASLHTPCIETGNYLKIIKDIQNSTL